MWSTAVLVSTLVVATQAPRAVQGLTVLPGPGAGRCPSADQVVSALKREADGARLPELPQLPKGWLLRYEPTVGDQGGTPQAPRRWTAPRQVWRLRLIDPQGGLRLERHLEVDPRACAAAAEAMAVVVQRFFREIAWQNGASASVPPGAAVGNGSLASPPPGGTTDGTTGGATRRGRPLAVTFGAGPGLLFGRWPQVAAAAELDVWLGARWTVGVGTWLPSGARTEQVGGPGRATVRMRPLRLSARLVWPAAFSAEGPSGGGAGLGRLWLWTGPSLLLSFDGAETEGFLAQGPTERVWTGLGARAGLALGLGRAWWLALDGSVHLRLAGAPLGVEQSAPALAGARATQGTATLWVGYAFPGFL